MTITDENGPKSFDVMDGQDGAGGGGTAGVSSFNDRTGDVKPQEGDYTAEMVGAVSPKEMETALSGKQEQLTPDESLVLDGGNISVKIPTRHLTKAEYNALTEEEKQADILYIVPVDNPGGADWEIYSTKEIPVGIWIDGKTIYRRVFPFTTPGSPSAPGELVWHETGVAIEGVETLASSKIVMSSSNGFLSAGQSTNNLSIEGGKLLCSIQRYDTLCSRPAFAVVEYTKTDG